MGNCTAVIKKLSGVTPTGQVAIVDITLSASYATGGDTVPLAALGLPNGCDYLELSGNSPTSGVVLAVVHGATPNVAPKIKAYQDVTPAATAPLPEVAAATNMATHTVRAIAYSLPNP